MKLYTLMGHSWDVESVAFSNRGNLLASGDLLGGVTLWDVERGKFLFYFRPSKKLISSLAFSPDDKLLAIGISEAGHITIHIWDLEKRERIQELKVPLSYAGYSRNVVSFSRDGRFLVAGSPEPPIYIWDTHSWQLVRTVEGKPPFALSPDGKKLAWVYKNRVYVVNIETGEKLRVIENDNCCGFSAFSPDGTQITVITADNKLKTWDIFTGELVGEVGIETEITYAVFSPRLKLIASIQKGNTVTFISVKTGKVLRKVKGHKGSINSISFNFDGSLLASAGADRQVIVWKITYK